MIIRPFLILTCLILCVRSAAQQGTLIIAVIANNGVVLAADSRTSFFDTDDHIKPPICFFDSGCKIFHLKQFLVGTIGPTSIGPSYFWKIFKEYNASYAFDGSIYNTCKMFRDFLDLNYPVNLFPERKLNRFIICGFEYGKPCIAKMDTGIELHYSGAITSEREASKYLSANNHTKPSLFDEIENTFYDYVAAEKLTNTVGGPISIMEMVSPGKTIVIKNDFSDVKYETLLAFYNAVKEGSIQMTYLIPDGKEKLLRLLKR